MKKFSQRVLTLLPTLTILFFVILAYTEDNKKESKEKLLVKDLKFDREKGIVSYELTTPAWVRIRLGLKEGPMCKTLVDWEKRSAERHEEKWDGLDLSGTVKLPRKESLVFTFNYFTAGNEYIERAGIGDFMMPPENMIVGRSAPTLQINMMHKQHPRQFCHEPRVNLSLPENILKTEKGSYILEDKVPIEISVAGVDEEWFRRERYSIHMFVDGVFISGELEGYSPYTWVCDPKNLNQGEHLLVVNLSGFKDHIGIGSIPVYVKKEVKHAYVFPEEIQSN